MSEHHGSTSNAPSAGTPPTASDFAEVHPDQNYYSVDAYPIQAPAATSRPPAAHPAAVHPPTARPSAAHPVRQAPTQQYQTPSYRVPASSASRSSMPTPSIQAGPMPSNAAMPSQGSHAPTRRDKKPGVAVALALLFGIFCVFGLGHIYAGRVARGFGLMIGYWVLLCSLTGRAPAVTVITWLALVIFTPIAASRAAAKVNT
jgi:TM2 domain-containing membrane protein YozV